MGWVVRVTPRPCFTPGERISDTHWTGGCVDLRAGLDKEARGKIISPLPGFEPRSPGRPVCRHYTDWATPAPPLEQGRWNSVQRSIINICRFYVILLWVLTTIKMSTLSNFGAISDKNYRTLCNREVPVLDLYTGTIVFLSTSREMPG
jgi:hypothetical protein